MPTTTSGRGGIESVAFPGARTVSVALRSTPYHRIYEDLVSSRAYNVRLPDGAIIQLMYAFSKRTLVSHRLAFFPSPRRDDHQEQLLVEDEEHWLQRASDTMKNVPLPQMRFDYNSDPGLHQEVTHPRCHLTLGQHEVCRIPVTSPLTPQLFVDFILRNFYESTPNEYLDALPNLDGQFDETITAQERKIIHIGVPS